MVNKTKLINTCLYDNIYFLYSCWYVCNSMDFLLSAFIFLISLSKIKNFSNVCINYLGSDKFTDKLWNFKCNIA